jgi:hypothetical protein
MSYTDTFRQKCKIFGIPTDGKNYKEVLKNYSMIRIILNESIRDDTGRRPQILNWCEDNFQNNWIWSATINGEYLDIYFINDADAIISKLKWA